MTDSRLKVPLKCENMDPDIAEFIQAAMHADPVQRPTPKALLAHPFVARIPEPSPVRTSTEWPPRGGSNSPATPVTPEASLLSPVQPNNIGFCEGFGPSVDTSNSDDVEGVEGAEAATVSPLTLSFFSSSSAAPRRESSGSTLPPTPLPPTPLPHTQVPGAGAGADDPRLGSVSPGSDGPMTAAGGTVPTVVFSVDSVDGDGDGDDGDGDGDGDDVGVLVRLGSRLSSRSSSVTTEV